MRVDPETIVAECEVELLTAPEVCSHDLVSTSATRIEGDIQVVVGADTTTSGYTATQTATWAATPQATMAIADMPQVARPGDVDNVGYEVSTEVSGSSYTRDVHPSATGAHTQVDDGREAVIEAFWSLLKNVGYESC